MILSLGIIVGLILLVSFGSAALELAVEGIGWLIDSGVMLAAKWKTRRVK